MKLTKAKLQEIIKEELEVMREQDVFAKLNKVLSGMTNGWQTDMELDVEDVAGKMGMTEQELASLLVSEEKYDDEINYYVKLVIKTDEDGPANV